jgi:hypothetical protein
MPHQDQGQRHTLNSKRFPSLYQVNIRVVLHDLSKQLGRTALLDEVPDANIEAWAAYGFDYVWLLSVWQTGPTARAISRSHAALRREFEKTLPDLTIDDIEGSGFAIQAYDVDPGMGGNEALARFRKRMASHGLKLILDFVPNHVAPDHRWVSQNPDYIVQGSEQDFVRSPQNYHRMQTASGERIFAMGRDPYFDGWTDTLQLNYGNPALQSAMMSELVRISTMCDGVRCDMAMLLEPDVFKRTWGIDAELFWPTAIRQVQFANRDFLFMAEVYWDREWSLIQQGFDYCYDKQLYDRLHDQDARPVLNHLQADPAYQNRLVRFLENHDEPRAANAFDWPKHQAAAVLTYLVPGLRFFHQGQLEGRTVKISPQLIRMPDETTNTDIKTFYDQLLKLLEQSVVHRGAWQLIETIEAWQSNASFQSIIAFQWQQSDGARLLVVVNYSSQTSQARLKMSLDPTTPMKIGLHDLMNDAVYVRETRQIMNEGLYIELAAWGVHLFQVQ